MTEQSQIHSESRAISQLEAESRAISQLEATSQSRGLGQSKLMSLLESSVSVIAGFILTVVIQYWLYPLLGVIVPADKALLISVIIVFSAFVKNFGVRRLFNALHLRAQR